MTLILASALIANAVSVVTLDEVYKVGEVSFDDCASAIQYAETLHTESTVVCQTTHHVNPGDSVAGPATQTLVSVVDNRELNDFRMSNEIELSNPDASGVTFITDDTVLITYQTSLEFRRLDGKVLRIVDGIDGDVEGLEYHGKQLYAVAERGSTHIELSLEGMNLTPITDYLLPGGGIECIAQNPETSIVYYGQEYSGNLIDDQNTVVFSFARDLSACAVYGDTLMAITSHPWRPSVWHQLDMKTWKVIARRPLMDGDWEGVSCKGNRCALVRESSEHSQAALVIYEARKAD